MADMSLLLKSINWIMFPARDRTVKRSIASPTVNRGREPRFVGRGVTMSINAWSTKRTEFERKKNLFLL